MKSTAVVNQVALEREEVTDSAAKGPRITVIAFIWIVGVLIVAGALMARELALSPESGLGRSTVAPPASAAQDAIGRYLSVKQQVEPAVAEPAGEALDALGRFLATGRSTVAPPASAAQDAIGRYLNVNQMDGAPAASGELDAIGRYLAVNHQSD